MPKVARIEAGVIAEIFDGSGPVIIGGESIAFKHIITWLKKQPQELSKRGLVEITVAPKPSFDALRQTLRPILVKLGDTTSQDTWEIVARPSASARESFVNDVKDRAWELFGRGFFDRNQTDWFSYRNTLRTHGLNLVTAFDQGRSVHAVDGSIDGTGSWPL